MPLPGLWVAGDSAGDFRGLTAALISGFVAGAAISDMSEGAFKRLDRLSTPHSRSNTSTAATRSVSSSSSKVPFHSIHFELLTIS